MFLVDKLVWVGFFVILLEVLSMPSFAAKKLLPLSGSFLQLDDGNINWSEEQWEDELQQMRELGMDTLVIQTCLSDKSGAYYNSAKFKHVKGFGCEDPVGTILTLSEKLKIKVFLGLQDYDIWQEYGAWDKHFGAMVEKSKPVAEELANLYGKRKAFAGWYITQEFCDWTDPDEKMSKAYQQVADYCRDLIPKKPVMIAPFFSVKSLDEKACREGWTKLLPELHVDILAVQDGVGCCRGLSPENIAPAYHALAEVCKKNRVQFWSDLEIFESEDGWGPAPVTRIISQARAVSPYVKKIVVFEYNHYMSRLRGKQEKKLYEEYWAALHLKESD